MASQISWLDFSEQERRKMIEVIQLYKEQDTRDEFGIGSVRDTLAELLFPGTPAEVPAMPPKPRAQAIRAMIRNVNAQLNIEISFRRGGDVTCSTLAEL
jgi:hypothetical protein